jgi:uncharacterized protein
MGLLFGMVKKTRQLTESDREIILQKTRDFVRTHMRGDGSAHDWWHVVRVVSLAEKIGKTEGVNLFVTELGALLHDIADWKFTDGNISIGPEMARDWLESLAVNSGDIDKIVEIVAHISYRGGTNKHIMQSIEGKVVQDADRLDGLGAIGVARAFSYGGHMDREIYNPNIKVTSFENFEDYRERHAESTTINHFHEKILFVKDRMNTRSGKQIAEHRHKYMERFLEEFYAEWDGKS